MTGRRSLQRQGQSQADPRVRHDLVLGSFDVLSHFAGVHCGSVTIFGVSLEERPLGSLGASRFRTHLPIRALEALECAGVYRGYCKTEDFLRRIVGHPECVLASQPCLPFSGPELIV